MFEQTDLAKNITKNNQLPTNIKLISQLVQDDVRIQFRNEGSDYSKHRPFMLTPSYVDQLSHQIRDLVNNELFGIRALIKDVIKSKKGINSSTVKLNQAQVIVDAAVTSSLTSDSLIGEKIMVEIKIPFNKCGSFKDFFHPVSQLFIPIAEFVQHFEIKASNFQLYHLHAFLTFSKEEILYVCQNPIEPCKKTKEEWTSFLLKLYEQTLSSHTITFEVDCMDGKLVLANSLISLPAISFEKLIL
ncbi:hypothetical protein ACQKNX_23015 [Lysinibacillus sp. NPDC093712]|uniref:hypothetical protein n=1 Tax=Lysinibacillus sp. NPDC093712 TaxID=3390579 RepID=UPI003D01C352